MVDRVDVLIVGAGASGAAVAWRLAEAGIDVLCLCRGGVVPRTDVPSTGAFVQEMSG
jgi:choline dehydrogenase-like flavoprotein